MEIRAATLDDLEAVERLLIRTFSGQGRSVLGDMPEDRQVQVRLEMRRTAPDPTAGLLVAVDGPVVAGVVAMETAETAGLPGLATLRALRPLGLTGMARFFALSVATLYRPAPDEAYLLGMAVAPEYRRRGLAARLTQTAEEYARIRGKTTASLLVAPDNHASLELSRSCGYVEAPARSSLWRRMLPGHAPVVHMRRALAPLESPPSVTPARRRPAMAHAESPTLVQSTAQTHKGV